uniref:NADH dehydrogenase (Ubiquinone) complex I, assembly factor 6 n=1 Tax=Plectus sambesii TaxID=2011161 RepID=A0A914WE44_9BILA
MSSLYSHNHVSFSTRRRRLSNPLSIPLEKSKLLLAAAVVSISTSSNLNFSSRQFSSSASNPPSNPSSSRQSPSAASPPVASFQYCVDLVFKNDYENYLATLLLPAGCQRIMFAIRAFNVELALVRNQIQRYSGTTGIYRLQFWKDTIDMLYGVKKGPVPRQPVAIALKKFASLADKKLLYQLVEARQATLGDRPFVNVAALEEYGMKTHGALLRCAVAAIDQEKKSLSAENAAVCQQVCDILGSALGLGTHLRATGPLLARGIVVLPADLMSIHGLSQEAVFTARDPPAFKSLSRDLAQLAEKRLAEARAMTSKVPREFRPAFLPAVGLENYLTRLKKSDYNLLDPKLQRSYGLLSWQLGWRKLCGRY